MSPGPAGAASTTYLRWKSGEARVGRLFDGPSDDDEDRDAGCPGCDRRLAGHGAVRLVALGPSDSDDQDDHQAGKWYSALAIVAHDACARRVDDEVSAVDPATVEQVLALLDRWCEAPA